MSGFRIGNLWSIHLPSCFPSSCCPSACLHASLLVCLCLRQSETHKQGHNSVGTPYRKSICPVVIRPYLYMIRVMYICIHVYITYVYIMLYIYIYTDVYTYCVYIYIYIERERERDLCSSEWGLRGRLRLSRAAGPPFWAQDKGGPSKGGFLNNRLFSYTDLYLCNEINGMYIDILYHSGK